MRHRTIGSILGMIAAIVVAGGAVAAGPAATNDARHADRGLSAIARSTTPDGYRNHGAFVSEAAKAKRAQKAAADRWLSVIARSTTPDGYRNHGVFVSETAKAKHSRAL
jgi:hypothetical protein